MPCSCAILISGKRGSMPGLNTMVSLRSIQSFTKPPVWTNTSGNSVCNVAKAGGLSRVSITATIWPCSTRKRAQDNPVWPKPMIKNVFACACLFAIIVI